MVSASCAKEEECECGGLFFLTVVEARSARVRSGKGQLVLTGFTTAAWRARHLSPLAFGLRARRKKPCSQSVVHEPTHNAEFA